MKRRLSLLLAILSLLTITACQESRITATVGTASVSGTVVMAGALAGEDPSGIEVRVPGTGIAVQTSEEGRFHLTALPSGEIELLIHRADGIAETRTVNATTASPAAITVEISARRGRGRPVSKPPISIQGAILEVGTDSIRIDGAREGELVVGVSAETRIYKGSVRLLLADLRTGDLVHVRAFESDSGDLLADSIVVNPRHKGDPSFLPRSAVGTIQSISGDHLLILTENGSEITVRVDARTVIYLRNGVLDLEDLRAGDRIKAFGVILPDEQVLLASWIRVKPRGSEEEDGEDDHGEDDGAVHGVVLSNAANALVVRHGSGAEITVEITDTTEIKHRGKPFPPSEITPGMRITAIGERTSESTLRARKINVH